MKKPRKTETSVWEEPESYDKNWYHSHLLDQYKIYVEMTDRLAARRVLINNSFITLIGAGAIAYAAAPNNLETPALLIFFQFGVSVVTLLLAVMWRSSIVYYRELATAKFKVICEMEELLPAQPFRVEWQYVQAARHAANKKETRGLATIEMNLPVIAGFFALVGMLATMISAYQRLADVFLR